MGVVVLVIFAEGGTCATVDTFFALGTATRTGDEAVTAFTIGVDLTTCIGVFGFVATITVVAGPVLYGGDAGDATGTARGA